MMGELSKEQGYLWKARLASVALVAFALVAATSAVSETVTKEKVLAAIPRLEELANKAIADGGAPGLAIAVVYKDNVVYLGGFGVREAGRPDLSMLTRCFSSHSFPSQAQTDVNPPSSPTSARACA
jgi:CubicO group peptidase (beta-lactamase class C family)